MHVAASSSQRAFHHHCQLPLAFSLFVFVFLVHYWCFGREVSSVGSVGGGGGVDKATIYSLVLTNTSKHCTYSQYLVCSNIKEFSDSQTLYYREIFINTTHCIIELTSYTKFLRLKTSLATRWTTGLPFPAADRSAKNTQIKKKTPESTTLITFRIKKAYS
jgi:hypothetical protein